MPLNKKPSTSTPITSHTYADTRPDIPTEEMRDFIAEAEKKPKAGKITVKVINQDGDEVLKVYDV
jgi:hypothetical protein